MLHVSATAPYVPPNIRFSEIHYDNFGTDADEAIEHHGFWAGGWMTLARLLRCHPLGTSGLDFVPGAAPPGARWYLPWRYARWRGVNNPPQ